MAKLQQQLRHKARNTTGVNAMAAQPVEEAPIPVAPYSGPTAADMASMMDQMKQFVNAVNPRGRNSQRTPPGSRSGSNGSQRAGRRIPSAKFEGCWCCGSKEHSRKTCPKFAAIRKANGGKVPKDYEGAYERSLKKSGSVPVTPVMTSGPLRPNVEHPETDMTLWPMLTHPSVLKRKPPSAPVMPLVNKFEAFTSDSSDDEEDEEESLVKALNSMTPHVAMASDRSRSQKERKRNSKRVNLAYLNSVAKQVKSGKIALPDLDLETDSEFEYVWAMVDSGAGANVARREHFSSSFVVHIVTIFNCE